MEAQRIARHTPSEEPAIPFEPIPVIASFVLGSIPWGLWIGRARGVDLRRVGSGNTGATNAFRYLGPRWGALIFLLDALKGVAAPLLSQHVPTQIASGVAAILGHVFSPWLRFRGGRGVATSLGVFLALLPVPALAALGVWVLLVLATRRVSVGSVGAALAYPFLVAWIAPKDEYRAALLAMAAAVAVLVLVRHLPNIRRLLAGNEPPTFGRNEVKS